MFDFISDHPVIGAIVTIVVVVVLLTAFTFIARNVNNLLFGGNEQAFDTTWRYEWAIVQLGNGELLEGQITSWKDFSESDMIQFTMNGITYLTHSSNVVLCTRCP